MNFYTNHHNVSSFLDKSGFLLNYSTVDKNYQLYFKNVQEALKQLNFKYVKDITGESIVFASESRTS